MRINSKLERAIRGNYATCVLTWRYRNHSGVLVSNSKLIQITGIIDGWNCKINQKLTKRIELLRGHGLRVMTSRKQVLEIYSQMKSVCIKHYPSDVKYLWWFFEVTKQEPNQDMDLV